MTHARHVELVACAAPLAERVGEFATAVAQAGWIPSITLSRNAAAWVDESTITSLNLQLKQTRLPGERKMSSRPDAVVLIPGTFNTLNKLRAGISDTPALGVLNDALGAGVPLLVVPMVNVRLAGHPAWHATLQDLRGQGVAFLDPNTGKPGPLLPLESGTGADVASRFDPGHLLTWLHGLIGSSKP